MIGVLPHISTLDVVLFIVLAAVWLTVTWPATLALIGGVVSAAESVKHRVFGHRFHYEELDREEPALKATCIYSCCDYEKTLTEDTFE